MDKFCKFADNQLHSAHHRRVKQNIQFINNRPARGVRIIEMSVFLLLSENETSAKRYEHDANNI